MSRYAVGRRDRGWSGCVEAVPVETSIDKLSHVIRGDPPASFDRPPMAPVYCPGCCSRRVETVADLPVLKVYRCEMCLTGFAIVPLAETRSHAASPRGRGEPESESASPSSNPQCWVF
jgi:hypothetical protein